MSFMFMPLIKADATQRLVHGYIDETPDRSGEIMDYASAKLAFQKWSGDMQKASGGKSYGNIREQHDMKKACGRLVEISYDDATKRIGFVGEIVDDQTWAKVEAGVITGFSPGGRYAKRWRDGKFHRYTPTVGELSVVDIPCIPSGHFDLTKADGSEETVEFVIGKAYEPGNEATLARADVLAKAVGSDAKAKDYVVQARADLIAENAAAELAKMAPTDGSEEQDEAEQADPLEALNAALSKADNAIAAVAAGAEVAVIVEVEGYADLAKAAAALQLIAETVQADEVIILEKSLYTVERTACALSRFGDILTSIAYEERAEGDTASPLPAQAADIVNRTKALLISMANEEVAELLAGTGRDTGFAFAATADDTVMKTAEAIIAGVQADTDLMEKAGARNSRSDLSKIQSMHDHAVNLGADCGCDMAKAASLEEDNATLTKALGDVAPKIETLAKTVESLTAERATDRERIAALTAQVEKIGAEPDLRKGLRGTISKEDEAGALNKDLNKADENLSFGQRLARENDPNKRAQMVLGAK